jgi:hypothetical protein
MNMKRLAGAALVIMALATPALGQGMDFQQLLSGKEVPNALQLKDLNSDWRHLSIGTTDAAKGGLGDMLGPLMQAGMMSDKGKGNGKDDAASAMLGMAFMSALFGGGSGDSQKPVYYTQGRTVTVGGETFLVAYRYQKPPVNLMQLAMQADKAGKDPDASKTAADGKLTPESPLTLSLINVKTITTLADIRPFDMAQEMAESANAGGGLMDLIAQQAAQEAQQAKPKPASTTAGAKPKPAAGSKPQP